MGNSETKENNALKDWEKLDIYNGIEIFKNIKTQQVAQKRVIVLEPDVDLKKQLRIYKIRQNNNDGLVKAYNTDEISKKAEGFVSCAGQNKIYVLTENMPFRLTQLPQLTFQQSLLFLRQCLRGYQKIFKQYGAVQVTSDMIGLNYFGEVKSWLNSNWALNHRNNDYSNLRSKKLSQLSRDQYLSYRQQYLDQPQMIRGIISVIENKCEDKRFPPAFKEQVIIHSDSFKKMLSYLKDFIDCNEIYVPQKIHYNQLNQNNYHIRSDHQDKLRGHRLHQHYNLNLQDQTHQHSAQGLQHDQNGFFSMILQTHQINQPSSVNPQAQQINSFQQKPNQLLGYQGSQQTKGYSLSLIPDPRKQSPVASDIGQVTFSQSRRNYSQGPELAIKGVSNYSHGASTFQKLQLNQKFNTPSFQKIEQSPQMRTYPTNQVKTYNIELSSNQQEGFLKPSYGIQGVETSYQGPKQGFSYGGLNRAYPSATLTNNINTNTNKYITSTLGNTGTDLNQEKINNNNYGLSSNSYNYSGSYSSASPNLNLKTGSSNSTKDYTYSNLSYVNLPTNNNLPINNTNNNLPLHNTNMSPWTFSNPSSNNYFVTQTYHHSSSKPLQPSYSTTQKISTYNFDQNNSVSNKTTLYTGSGYSNTLTKYQSEISTVPSLNSNLQDKYSQAFSALISPSLRGEILNQVNSGQSHLKNVPNGSTHVATENVVTTAHLKHSSSNISGQNVSGKNIIPQQQSITPKNPIVLESFDNMVERASNDVSESVLRME